MNNKPIVVNLFSGPCAGKSTLAAYIFSILKFKKINCELSEEWFKKLIWDRSYSFLKDEIYVASMQYHNLFMLKDTDVIVTDAPFILSTLYAKNKDAGKYKHFDKLLFELFYDFNNINYFVLRNEKEYNEKGRIHNLEESIEIDKNILDLLNKNKIHYETVHPNIHGAEIIINDIIQSLKYYENL